ncbi:MAG: tetratricopeptide repeat protein [Anaerolineae bacterium]|nr:tetratricopeptide repeat protein [Anaerolineae bacterium]MDW8173541.1 CheR family methyltransferase [Anaerolineae bacterium]
MNEWDERLRQLIEARTGLAVGARLRSDVDALFAQLDRGNRAAYYHELQASDLRDPRWQELIHALTIGETYFLRDRLRFKLLKDDILPNLVQRKRRAKDQHLRLWSAGCASGEEAYSLAMVVYESLMDLERWQITILGTDLDEQAIAAARRGVYREWSFRHASEGLRPRYFTQVGEGLWQIAVILRRMVTFQQGNLLQTAAQEMDIIFCRNVLIYLSATAVRQLEDMLYEALSPGGWLVLGEAEALRHQRQRWQMHLYPGAPLYQKPQQEALPVPVQHKFNVSTTWADTPSREAQDRTRYEQALALMRAEQYLEAEQLLGLLLIDEPNHAEAHVLLATLFANRQALPEAQTHLEKALRLQPMLANAHYMIALIRLEQDDAERAERSLRAALYVDRQHVLAHFLLGVILARRGEMTRAHNHWQQARDVLRSLPPEAYVSQLNAMRAADMLALVQGQIDEG